MPIHVKKKCNVMSETVDKRLSLALMTTYVVLTIQYFILLSFDLTDTPIALLIQYISKIIVGAFYLYTFPKAYKRNKLKFLVVYYIATFIFVVNYGFFPDSRLYLKKLLIPVFFISLPTFIYSLSIQNFKIFLDIIRKASNIVFITGAVIASLVFVGKANIGNYSMTLSYYMLLPMIIYLDELMDGFSIHILIRAFVSFIIIVSIGSRGAILCIIIFIFLKYVRAYQKLNYKKVITQLGILSIGIFFFLKTGDILEFVYNLLLRFGIRSRSIFIFLKKDIYLSGREDIYKVVYEAIIKNPLTGNGVAGDNYILNGGFPHNIILEIFSDFGLVFGLIILLTIFFKVVWLFVEKDNLTIKLGVIWMSLGFIHLFVSGTYMTDVKFWIFIGVLFNEKRFKNIYPTKNNEKKARINKVL